MKKIKLLIIILFAIMVNISLIVMLNSDNILYRKKGVKEKSGIKKKIEEDIKKKIMVQIIRPYNGETVDKTFIVSGIAGEEVESVEVKLDNEEWKKAKGNPWTITLESDTEGMHTITARGKSKYTLKGSDSIEVNIIKAPGSLGSLWAPGSVTASDGTFTNMIRIAWSAVSDADKYYVYRATNIIGPYSEIVNTTSITFDDTTVLNYKTYYYKVKSFSSSAGYSTNSSYDNGFRFLFLAPTGIWASDGIYTNKINISWNSVIGAEEYYIDRSTTSTGNYTNITNTISTSYDDYTAPAGTTYYYKVRAYCILKGYSASGDFDAGFAILISTNISAPTNVIASDGVYANRIEIIWSTVSNAEEYHVYRSTNSGGIYSEIGMTTTATTYDDTTGTPGIVYYYKIRSYSAAAGFSFFSEYDSGYMPLPVPSGISASDGDYTNIIRITWNSVPEAEKYYVYRATNAAGAYSEITNTISPNFDDAAVSNYKVYYYKVRSYSSAVSYSGYSSSNDGFRFLFAAPTGVSASDGTYTNWIYISWNNVTGAENYSIYRSTISNGSYTSNGNTASTFYNDYTASAGTNYYYKVRAWCSLKGYSDYSDYDNGSCVAGLPTGAEVIFTDTGLESLWEELIPSTAGDSVITYTFSSNIEVEVTVGSNPVAIGFQLWYDQLGWGNGLSIDVSSHTNLIYSIKSEIGDGFYQLMFWDATNGISYSDYRSMTGVYVEHVLPLDYSSSTPTGAWGPSTNCNWTQLEGVIFNIYVPGNGWDYGETNSAYFDDIYFH